MDCIQLHFACMLQCDTADDDALFEAMFWSIIKECGQHLVAHPSLRPYCYQFDPSFEFYLQGRPMHLNSLSNAERMEAIVANNTELFAQNQERLLSFFQIVDIAQCAHKPRQFVADIRAFISSKQRASHFIALRYKQIHVCHIVLYLYSIYY